VFALKKGGVVMTSFEILFSNVIGYATAIGILGGLLFSKSIGWGKIFATIAIGCPLAIIFGAIPECGSKAMHIAIMMAFLFAFFAPTLLRLIFRLVSDGVKRIIRIVLTIAIILIIVVVVIMLFK
jgi:hypothetical protein